MTVSELIEELKKMSKDAEVIISPIPKLWVQIESIRQSTIYKESGYYPKDHPQDVVIINTDICDIEGMPPDENDCC